VPMLDVFFAVPRAVLISHSPLGALQASITSVSQLFIERMAIAMQSPNPRAAEAAASLFLPALKRQGFQA
jgi:hypothetical protein